MSKLTFPLLLTFLVFWLVGATWWFNKKYDHIGSLDKSECDIPFLLSDGNFQTQAENTFFFKMSDWEPTIPMQTLASFKSVALYLANSAGKNLTLTGWHGLNETNNSDFDNNGLARAEAIKSELVTYGAPENNIIITSDSMEQIQLSCGKILGGVDFRFSEPLAKVEEPSTAPKNTTSSGQEDQSQSKNNTFSASLEDFDSKKTYIVFYEENTFIPEVNETRNAYFEALAKYLKEHPKDRLLLLGHTDSIGDKKKHFNFGKYRARKLRDVLLDYGIEKRRIKTDSKGSSKPLASNKSSEGRYQNRRVEISIIKR